MTKKVAPKKKETHRFFTVDLISLFEDREVNIRYQSLFAFCDSLETQIENYLKKGFIHGSDKVTFTKFKKKFEFDVDVTFLMDDCYIEIELDYYYDDIRLLIHFQKDFEEPDDVYQARLESYKKREQTKKEKAEEKKRNKIAAAKKLLESEGLSVIGDED